MGQLNQVQVINIGRLNSDSGVQGLLFQPPSDLEFGIFQSDGLFAGTPACMVRLEGVVGLNARF